MSALRGNDGHHQRYPSGKAIYKCDGCGRVGPWTDSWLWFGSFKEVDDGVDVPTFCAKSCAQEHHKKATAMPFEVQP